MSFEYRAQDDIQPTKEEWDAYQKQIGRIAWIKAKLGQIMCDGDEILAAIRNVTTGKIGGYSILKIACDEDYFSVRDQEGEVSDYDWSDIAYWCYTRDIPSPEQA